MAMRDSSIIDPERSLQLRVHSLPIAGVGKVTTLPLQIHEKVIAVEVAEDTVLIVTILSRRREVGDER